MVVPGGMKFMKVLLALVRLLQTEALRMHSKEEWLELPADQIFNSGLRSRLVTNYEVLHRVSSEMQRVAQSGVRMYQKRREVLNYYSKRAEEYVSNFNAGQEQRIREDVAKMCAMIERVMCLVADVEKTCASGPEQQSDPFERIRLSKAIDRIVEHHKWTESSSNEYSHKIGCATVLQLAARIFEGHALPKNDTHVDAVELVNQNHDMSIFLGNLATIEQDLQTVTWNLGRDQGRARSDTSKSNVRTQKQFPERDYPLAEVEDVDLGAFYNELQRLSLVGHQSYRLALEDALANVSTSNISPSSIRSPSMIRDRSLLSTTTAKRSMTTTTKKRTKALSVLKTISRSNKRPNKVNMDALRELARNGFNESLLDSSQITWKKKSVNSSSIAEAMSESLRPPAARLSAIFSDSVAPKLFMPNSTSIFNSTTNEQAQLHSSIAVHLGDITNRDRIIQFGKEEDKGQEVIAKGRLKIDQENEPENILDCSDSVLIE